MFTLIGAIIGALIGNVIIGNISFNTVRLHDPTPDPPIDYKKECGYWGIDIPERYREIK